jgi:hypothetical protein
MICRLWASRVYQTMEIDIHYKVEVQFEGLPVHTDHIALEYKQKKTHSQLQLILKTWNMQWDSYHKRR